MSLTTFLQQCLTGISLGGAYALIAILTIQGEKDVQETTIQEQN